MFPLLSCVNIFAYVCKYLCVLYNIKMLICLFVFICLCTGQVQPARGCVYASHHVKSSDATGDQLPLMTVPSNFSLTGAQRASFGKIMLARQWCMPPKSQTRGSSSWIRLEHRVHAGTLCSCSRETQKRGGKNRKCWPSELFLCFLLNICTVLLSFAFSQLFLPVSLALHSVAHALVCVQWLTPMPSEKHMELWEALRLTLTFAEEDTAFCPMEGMLVVQNILVTNSKDI